MFEVISPTCKFCMNNNGSSFFGFTPFDYTVSFIIKTVIFVMAKAQ